MTLVSYSSADSFSVEQYVLTCILIIFKKVLKPLKCNLIKPEEILYIDVVT